ncbi:hypothetical protein ACSBR2_000595 [Camellia fascicularis]
MENSHSSPLKKNGNLIFTDAGQFNVWAIGTKSISSTQLLLYDIGNLVLLTSESLILWQSFDSPTDILLPNQPLTRNTKLVSSRSQNNYSFGFYKLLFNNDNILRPVFDGPEVTSVYWLDPWKNSWEALRFSFTNNRTATFNSSVHFKSNDDFQFRAVDFGTGIQRRLTEDHVGNIQVYSLEERSKTWTGSWQALLEPCRIHGYKIKNDTNWSLRCEPDFNPPCNDGDQVSLQLPHVEFYGYDIKFHGNYTLKNCKNTCLKQCNCYGFQYKFDKVHGFYNIFTKSLLFNGYLSSHFLDSTYIKLPKASLSFYTIPIQEFELNCSCLVSLQLDRTYRKPKENGTLQFKIWFATTSGGVEIICICFVLCFLFKTRQDSSAITESYLQVATGFRKFTYNELRKIACNFAEEIGRGGSGVVYKGVLSDHQIAAIKLLNEANQGEEEFLAEVSTIGRVNHMNLIEILGYCLEGKHRILVYEYMERRSLAKNLASNTLDWEKRFYIAIGSAKDFGLSKLCKKGGEHSSNFSRVRGTRGYTAPGWISNLRITSKVDVYSYGVVVLEMVTRKSSMTNPYTSGNSREMEQRGLVKWVREKINGSVVNESWLEEIIDPVMMKSRYDASKMEILIKVALQCVVEDKDARPTMIRVK